MIEKIQIVVNDFKESLEGMPAESVGHLLIALMKYANDEDPTEILKDDTLAKIVFPTLKAHVERHEEYRRTKQEAGRKGGKMGGAPVGNQNAVKVKQNKANQSKTKQNKPPNPNPNPNPYPNPLKDKKTFGECANVLLTDEEHDKIIAEGLTGLIDELSLYIASKGDKYKSHYAVIKQWANRRKKEQEEKKVIRPNQFTDGVRTREIDFSDLEKRLIKN